MEPLPPGGQLTNLHYHGLRVTPTTRKFQGMDVFGDNVLLSLGPGPSHFRFNIPKHHDQGTFWYHAHRHGCTDDQVFRGLAGVLLIGDSRLTLPRRFRHVRERTLALKDIQAVPDVSDVTGAPWAIPSDHDWAHPTQRTVNGQVQPDIPIQPGETQLWRVANISAAVWYRIAVEDGDRRLPYTVVARDGNPMSRPEQRGAALLGPGHRLDIIVTAPAGGSLALKTLPFDQGRLTFPEETLATATPAGTPAKSRSVDRRRKPLPHFPPVVRTRHFDFSFNRRKGYKKDPAAFAFINGTPFDPDHTNVKPRLGTTERWVLTNSSTEWHPFHIHQNDFRVISVNGRRIKHPAGDQDVVPLPPMRANGKPGRVVILMPFTKFKGRFVFHCHILDHEDGGMMKLVVVR
jgi:FtsP/CotA-like multicopper oxidase with cupredoxin domain